MDGIPPTVNRALVVRGLLGDLWGNGMPPTPDPWLTMTVDGVACDDLVGRERGFVVFGDGLHLSTLRAIIAASSDAEGSLRLLPSELRRRVETAAPGPYGGTVEP